MEDWVHVHKTVRIPLDHSSATVCPDILCLDMPAMVRCYKSVHHAKCMYASVISLSNWFHISIGMYIGDRFSEKGLNACFFKISILKV